MSEENPPDNIRPLIAIWLKPRRVFRELAEVPIGRTDYLLAAAQGMVSWLALCRAQSLGLHNGVAEILTRSLYLGPIAGVLGILVMTALYGQIGRRVGGHATRTQVFHVLAYGGVPLVVSLGIWVVTALLLGAPVFVEKAPTDLELVPGLLLKFQTFAHLALIGWSLLIQIMGFSEVQGLAIKRSFGVWVIGQLFVVVAVIVLAMALYGPDVAPPA
jgi:Yip1 domain